MTYVDKPAVQLVRDEDNRGLQCIRGHEHGDARTIEDLRHPLGDVPLCIVVARWKRERIAAYLRTDAAGAVHTTQYELHQYCPLERGVCVGIGWRQEDAGEHTTLELSPCSTGSSSCSSNKVV